MSESRDNPVMQEPGGDQGPTFPSCVEALWLGPRAVLTVLRAPIVLLFVYVCLSLPAFLFLSAYYESMNAVLAGNPLANGHGGLLLLEDYDRLRPGGNVLPGLLQILWALMITFFAGGLVSTVGLGRKPRPGLSGFLSESGRLFFRSFRTLLPSLLLILAWSWIFVALLKPWLMGLGLVQASNARAFWVGFGLNILFLFGVGKILILRRLALARIVHSGRKSAIVAWLWCIRYWMRHPFVTLAAYLPLFLLFAGGALGVVYGMDFLLNNYFEPGSRPIFFMLAAQVFPIFYLALNLASFLLARHLVAIDIAIREGTPAEPQMVVSPRPSQSEHVQSLGVEPAMEKRIGKETSKAPEQAPTPDPVKPAGDQPPTAEAGRPDETVAWEWSPEDPPPSKD